MLTSANEALAKAATAPEIKAAVEQKLLAESMQQCSGCPGGSADPKCYGCHDWLYPGVWNGYPGCGFCEDLIYISTHPVGRPPMHPIDQKYIGVRGYITGKPIKIAANWEKIGMPAHHLEDAKAARATMKDCDKKAATQ